MNVAEHRHQQVIAQDNIRVITNALFLTKRIRDLQAKRQFLVSRQEQLRTQLPDWAVEPLRLVGMTGNEVRGLVDDLNSVEAESGLDDIETQLNDIDQQVEDLENTLVNTKANTPERGRDRHGPGDHPLSRNLRHRPGRRLLRPR